MFGGNVRGAARAGTRAFQPRARATGATHGRTRPGEPIELTLAEDLKVGDATVAKTGARALGEVVQGKRPDAWGEAWEVSLRVHFLRVGDQKVEIRGAIGSAGTRYVVIRGSQAIIKAGTPVKAFVAADVDVAPLPKAAEPSK